MGAGQRAERRLPLRRPGRKLAALRRQPVRRRVEVIGVAHLAGEPAPAVLLLVEVPEQGAGMRGARHDADLGNAPEVLVFLHAASSCARFYALRRREGRASLAQRPTGTNGRSAGTPTWSARAETLRAMTNPSSTSKR